MSQPPTSVVPSVPSVPVTELPMPRGSRARRRALRLLPAVVAITGLGIAGTMVTVQAAEQRSTSTTADTATTTAVVTAANAFLATLSSSQVDAVTYDYSDTATKYKWSNLPTTLTARNGLKLGDLTATQQTAALAVVRAELSDQGYTQEEQIRLADANLATVQANGYGAEKYYIAFFGTPSTSNPFFVQFGGHHLAINADFDGASVAITPEFVGVEPQTFTSNGTTYTPMSGEKSAVFNVLGSLDATTLAAAKLTGTFDDVVMGAGADTKTYPTNAGVLVSSLSAAEQALVTTAIAQWVQDFPADVAADYMSAYTAAYDQTYLAYGNTTSADGRAYFRLSGPRLWIEYIHQNGIVYQNQLHIHTVFRDKSFDYDANTATTSSTLTTKTKASLVRKRVAAGAKAKVKVKVKAAGTTGAGIKVFVDGKKRKTASVTTNKATKITLPKLKPGRHTVVVRTKASSAVGASKSKKLTLVITR